MSDIKAAVMTQVGKIEIQKRPKPVIKDDQVLVKIEYCGVCGSDVHYYEHGRIGDFVVTGPIILGHEAGGVIVEAGSRVKNVKVGDKVAIEPGYTCGKCEYCKSGRYNLCPDVIFMATPPYDGAFIEYVAYPADMVFRLPDNMDTMEGALIEPLSVGFHAASQGGAKPGQTAVILGSGCIGLCTMLALRHMGLRRIFIADMIDVRLNLANKLGAAEAINPGQTDLMAKIMELTGGQGADLVFETAGAKVTTQATARLVKRGGTIVLVGMAPDATLPYDLGAVLAKEAAIKTVFRYRNIYPMAIDAVAGGLPVKNLVSDTFGLDDVEKAIKHNIEHKAETIKVVIKVA